MTSLNTQHYICFLDDYNASDIITIFNLKPKHVIFIHENTKFFQNKFEDVKNYIHSKEKKIVVRSKILNKISFEEISNIIKQYPKENSIISLSNGNKLLSLLTYNLCANEGYKSFYYDTPMKNIISFYNNSIIPIDLKEHSMDLDDCIGSTGGGIISEATSFYSSKVIKKSLDLITSNYSLWNIIKNSFVVQGDYVHIRISNQKQKSEFIRFINALIQLNIADYYVEKDKSSYLVKFTSTQYKYFIASGSWLEALVFNIISEIKEVSDIRAGVKFTWDKDDTNVENEIDVLASSNGNLIYISCKDTSRYETPSLNEIDVNSEQIGGDNVKMVMVATSYPYRNTVHERAKAMGIELIIFDGNKDTLKRKLSSILM